jgi:hypothetical protein
MKVMRWAWAPLLVGLLVIPDVVGAGSPDRLDHFRAIASRYVTAADEDTDAGSLSELLAVVDSEVRENLESGRPYSSAIFIQERLNAFAEAWGGASLRVLDARPGGSRVTLLGLFTVTQGQPRGSLRFYGRAAGRAAVLAEVTHPGQVELREWPETGQFLVSWSGPETGRGSRPLRRLATPPRRGAGACLDQRRHVSRRPLGHQLRSEE